MKEKYTNTVMSYTQKLSVIFFMHKKGCKRLLKSYMPNRLTKTNYRIIAFIFDQCLKNIINKYISNEQTIHIQGSYIGMYVRFVLEIFKYCEKKTIGKGYPYF